ncbi:MAG: ABC transporter [Gemmataceae bacterium]
MSALAICTRALRRIYRIPRRERRRHGTGAELVALDDIYLEIPRGELFGVLGPNGAGKTTLIKILTTLLAPSGGQAWVEGYDVIAQAHLIRPRINMVSGGESCGYGLLTVRETLWLFARMYGVPSREALARIDHLLAAVDLADRAHTRISHLSTGLRQRLNFCRGFVTDPAVLFLDEPTLGLDVHAARTLRRFIRSWMSEHPERTILLTTHYMQEADELCDRVAIVDRGRIVACDTPAALKQRLRRHPLFRLQVETANGALPDLAAVPGVRHIGHKELDHARELSLVLQDDTAIASVVQKLSDAGARIVSLTKVEPTLEDVFVHLTGHRLNEEETLTPPRPAPTELPR